jgi:hypothetical protein
MSETTKPEFPRETRSSRHGGSEQGYAVEARCSLKAPINVAGLLLGDKWAEVNFKQSSVGVPGAPMHSILPVVGLLSYAAAQALRWWMHANSEASEGRFGESMGLETRIVCYEIKLDFSAHAVSADTPVGWTEATGIRRSSQVKEASKP